METETYDKDLNYMNIDIIGSWKCPDCNVYHYTAEHPKHNKDVLEHNCDCGKHLVVNFVLPDAKQNPKHLLLEYVAQRDCKVCGEYTEIEGFCGLPSHEDLTCPECDTKVDTCTPLEYLFPEISD